jgi:hypothetical protein
MRVAFLIATKRVTLFINAIFQNDLGMNFDFPVQV